MFDDNLGITLISMKLNHAAVFYFNCRKALPKCTQIEHEKKKSSDFQFSKEYRVDLKFFIFSVTAFSVTI